MGTLKTTADISHRATQGRRWGAYVQLKCSVVNWKFEGLRGLGKEE